MPNTAKAFDAELLSAAVQENVRAALAEDVGSGDISAELIPADQQARARVITREPGVFCGRPWVTGTAGAVDPAIQVHWHVEDGEALVPNQTLFELAGPARSLLTAERTMLNFVQLFSGTATLTARYVAHLTGTRAALLDTRKTVPGLRVGQKYAVACGGGRNHRLGLFDAFLIKENHIAAAGSISAALARARNAHPGKLLEVEVETLEQLDEAVAGGAEVVMLDNFDLAATRTAVERVAGRVKLESSGNVDETTIRALAQTGVDYISVGNLTKQVSPLDLSMRFLTQE